jgi:hypothetical protein
MPSLHVSGGSVRRRLEVSKAPPEGSGDPPSKTDPLAWYAEDAQ